jgi:hypothetical protein
MQSMTTTPPTECLAQEDNEDDSVDSESIAACRKIPRHWVQLLLYSFAWPCSIANEDWTVGCEFQKELQHFVYEEYYIKSLCTKSQFNRTIDVKESVCRCQRDLVVYLGVFCAYPRQKDSIDVTIATSRVFHGVWIKVKQIPLAPRQLTQRLPIMQTLRCIWPLNWNGVSKSEARKCWFSLESNELSATKEAGRSFVVKFFEVALEKGMKVFVDVADDSYHVDQILKKHNVGAGVGFSDCSIAFDVARQHSLTEIHHLCGRAFGASGARFQNCWCPPPDWGAC